jgi:hypothetical protein
MDGCILFISRIPQGMQVRLLSYFLDTNWNIWRRETMSTVLVRGRETAADKSVVSRRRQKLRSETFIAT